MKFGVSVILSELVGVLIKRDRDHYEYPKITDSLLNHTNNMCPGPTDIEVCN